MVITPPSHTRTEKTSDDWITPKWLIDRLGPFDLDPCASESQPWPCAVENWTVDDNGLMRPWHGCVWLNPPYGAAMEGWLNRLASHGSGVALVFARTETRAYFRHVWPFASSVLFLRGRLTFHYPDGSTPRNGANSGGPSVLIAYGTEASARLRRVADLGALLTSHETAAAECEAADRALFRLRETVAACLVRVDGGQEPTATAAELRAALADAWLDAEGAG